MGDHQKGLAHSLQALRLEPENGAAYYDVGMARLHQRQFDAAVQHLSEAVRLLPQGRDFQYNPVNMRLNLARALLFKGELTKAAGHLNTALKLDPENATVNYELAQALAAQGDVRGSLKHYVRAVRLEPKVDTSPTLHAVLGSHFARAGRFREALASAHKALQLALAAGETDLAQQIKKRIERYKQGKP